MIKTCDNLRDIAKVWCEAFCDGFDDVKYFYDNIVNAECYAYYDNENIASLFYLVDCNLNNKKSKYIYAACTLKAYRGKGYMSDLLDFVLNKFQSVCLIPADNDLVNFYIDRNFKYEHNINTLSFNESDVLINDYLFEGCSLDNPFILCSNE